MRAAKQQPEVAPKLTPGQVDDGTASSAAVVLPLLGLFLLMPPVVVLFAHGAGLAGVPLIVLYVFGIWCLLIASAAALAWRLGHRHPSPDAVADEPPHQGLP